MVSSSAFSPSGPSEKADFPWNIDHLPTKLFINNEFVDAKSDKFLTVYNPKDGSLVSDSVALAGEEDVDAAVQAAEAAFPAWRKTPPNIRRDMLLNLASSLFEHSQAMAAMTRATLGGPISVAGAMEIGFAVEALRYFAGWTDKLAGETYPEEDGFFKLVRQEPLGVVSGIIPWNAPIGSACAKAAPALATGNCFILKLSEKTPFAGLAMGSLIKAAGFPPGVFQILSGDGSTGAIIANHMRIRKVSFTGSTATGKKIQEMAARSNLKRVTLELGGKSPALIFNDANIGNAVTWCVNAITINTGQACFASSRVYVQSGIYDVFVQRYRALVEEKTKLVGDPDDPNSLVGPVVDEAQFNRGYYVAPTVFTDVAEDAEIIQQEIFGPVVVINRFESEDEVIKLANDTRYGLMAGVFTQDITRAMRISAELDSGMVGINAVSTVFWQTPFGGTKESGIGRENGIHAIRSHTEPKTVFINMKA
ncbi:hypothetical protein NW756_013479 [Fusarium oxysporum]|nr:hypothetical protein NW763_010549 [Fusarium oxysporum]KAJ4046552.1 hypothetical protein NW753_009373 [Fusarium oxysporum]KAJ4075258.1 hypothetical protein NW756_013479 [Fusarium oxysporum]KAJ4096014.1 hypothetical protein NW769_011619 [Fusarium oxysporum]KAJ4216823.1 hypothetical protein NW760_013439 [Fusarium oxysporum]